MVKQTLANLANDFEQSNLPYKVDLVDLNSINDQFQTLIAQSILEAFAQWSTDNQ